MSAAVVAIGISPSVIQDTDMTDFKWRGQCKACRRIKFFIRKATVSLPIGQVARSQDLMCGSCIRTVRANIK